MQAIAAFILLFGLGIGNSLSVAAALPYTITPEEMSRLPQYCAVRIMSDKRSPEYKEWLGRIGENFWDIHHYCHGINFINRYFGARTAYERKYYLGQASGEFDYFVNALKPDFTMGAELFSNRGELFKLMGKPGDAIKDLNKALNIDPKMVKPYIQLAELFEHIKDKIRALEIITEGLRNIPNSKALQRRYLELGGKLPYPEPKHNAPAEAAQSVAPPPKIIEESTASEKTANETRTSAPVMIPAKPAIEPKSGTPKNPYCRFCPD